jgi:hypothetical protein
MPRLESLAGVTGEYVCINEDIIRNASWNWSPMTAGDIAAKTGIGQRRYTHQALEELAAEAARAAQDRAGRTPAEIGAVLCCTCTSQRLIPSMATWLSAELGIFQTHASADLIAACAGLPYGLLEAIRAPHQANWVTVEQAAANAGLSLVRLYMKLLGSRRPAVAHPEQRRQCGIMRSPASSRIVSPFR